MKASSSEIVLCCECCGSTQVQYFGSKRGYSLNECKECGLVFVSPLPDVETLQKQYSTSLGYFANAELNLLETSSNHAERLSKGLEEAGVVKGRFLDIGCATGQLIYHLRNIGWDVSGCDVNEGAVKIAVANGLEAKVGMLEEIEFEQDNFEVAYMGDVLEHLLSPKDALRIIRKILVSEGVVAIKVPNASGAFASATLKFSKWSGMPWFHSEAPFHLYEFTPIAITKLLNRNGFKVIKVQESGKNSFSYIVGASGYFDTLKMELKRDGKYSVTTKVFKYLPALITVSVVVFPFWLYGMVRDRVTKKGSAIIVFAQKI